MGVNPDVPVVNAGFPVQGISLVESLGILLEARWLIAGFVFIACLGALAHIFVMPPVYQSDALLQVEQQPGGIGALEDFSDLSSLFETAAADMEVEILTSRAVLGPVVDSLDLRVSAQPEHFPVIGAGIFRRDVAVSGVVESWTDALEDFSGGWVKLKKYAWGGEAIKVDRFAVPGALTDEHFTVVAGEAGRYRLLGSDDRLLGKGVVGKTVTGSAADGRYTLLISTLRAKPGVHFNVSVKSRLDAIDQLNQSLTVTALTGSNDLKVPSGLIELSLEGADRERTTTIVNEIAKVYLRQNVARKSAQAEATIDTLREQLPRVKARLEESETELVEYRQSHGSVDVPIETQAVFEKIAALESEIAELKINRARLMGRFTPQFTARRDHVAELGDRITDLQTEKQTFLDEIEQKAERLPEAQQGVIRLSREVEVNQQLYTLLLNKLHELNVVSAGSLGNVQVIDLATIPNEPVGVRKSLVVSVYLLWGMLLGMGIAFLRKIMFNVVEDPDVIEKQLGLPVYAVVPHSARQKKILIKYHRKRGKHSVLSARDTDDVAVESLRGLRTWLNFALLGSKNNMLLITGPGPGVGKSFLSVNFGAVLAGAGKRTVVIDADLRKGRLHQYFGMSREPGLSDAIAGEMDIRQVTHSTEIDKLCIIPTGSLPSNPSELLLNERFSSMLGEISAGFDYVIIDSPPVLAVTDAAILGRLAGAALLVIKANTHPLRELEQTVKRLRQVDVNLKGVIFNDMVSSKYYGYGKYYGHAYSYASGK